MKTVNTATAMALAGTIALLGIAAAAGAARSVEMAGPGVVAPQIAAGTAETGRAFPPPFETSRLPAAKLPPAGKS